MQIIMEARPGQNNALNSHLEQNYFSVAFKEYPLYLELFLYLYD